MKAEERRRQIAACLTADRPTSAAALAARFHVSRQVIVGDIALLRAAGTDIVATPRGYQRGETGGLLRLVPCVHSPEEMRTELLAMVDNGCTVVDVVVEHAVYGQLTGQLSLSSRYDVEQFIEKSRGSAPLSSLTGGVHIHTLRCPDEEAFARVRAALEALGMLYRADEPE